MSTDKDSLKSKARDWVGENANTLNERRLSKDAAGNVVGGTFLPSKPNASVTGICAPQTIGGSSASAGVSLSQSSVTVLPSKVPALTVDQRIDQLNKKIAEYRNFLNTANVAGSTAFLDLLFTNISKELIEIQVEVQKLIANQYQPSLIPPSIPGMPYQGITIQPEIPTPYDWTNLPKIADTIKWYADNATSQGAMTPSGTFTNNVQENH